MKSYDMELRKLIDKQQEEMNSLPSYIGVLDANAAEERKLYKKHIKEILELKQKYGIEGGGRCT